MKIVKELYKGKRLSDGSHPIVIRISHLGFVKRISTSVKCMEKNWDKKRLCVKSRDAEHRYKNQTIDSIERRTSGNIQILVDQLITDNFGKMVSQISMGDNILSSNDPNDIAMPEKPFGDKNKPGYDYKTDDISFLSLIKLKIDTLTSLNTRRGYEGFLRYYLSKYDDIKHVNQIDQSFINRFIKDLEDSFNEKSSMKLLMISKMKAIINFGKEIGIIPSSLRLVFPKLRVIHSDRNLTLEEIRNIYRLFTERLRDDPLIKDPKTEALALFILDIAFQGLAPADIANLRIKDIKMTILKQTSSYGNENGIEERMPGESTAAKNVVLINTFRKKTGNRVQIVAACKPIIKIIRHFIKGKETDDYLLDCFNKNMNMNENQRQNRLANYFYKISRHINECVPLHRRITFYFARHAFCNLADSLDVPRHIIQTLIGHRTSVLEKSYPRAATLNEQYLISEKIFDILKG